MCLSVSLDWACGHVALSVPVRCDAYAKGECKGINEKRNPGGRVEYDCPPCKARAAAENSVTGGSLSSYPLPANESYPGAVQQPMFNLAGYGAATGSQEESSRGSAPALDNRSWDSPYPTGEQLLEMVEKEVTFNWSRPLPNPIPQGGAGSGSEAPVDILALHGYVDHEGEYGELFQQPKGKAAVRGPSTLPNPMETRPNWEPLNPAMQANPTHGLPQQQHSYWNYEQQQPTESFTPIPPSHQFPLAPPSLPGSVGYDMGGWGRMPQMGMGIGFDQSQVNPSGFNQGQDLPLPDERASGIEYMDDTAGPK